jgi:hypothetical protein
MTGDDLRESGLEALARVYADELGWAATAAVARISGAG